MLIDDDARGITLERAGTGRFRFPGVIESYQESSAAATVRYRVDDDPRIAVWRYEGPFRTQVLFLFDAADAELHRNGRSLKLAAGRARFGQRVKTVIAWNDLFVVTFAGQVHFGWSALGVCAIDRTGRERWRLTGPAGGGIRGYGDIGWRGDKLFASYYGRTVGFGVISPATGVVLNRWEAR